MPTQLVLLAFALTLVAGLATGLGGVVAVLRRSPGTGFLAGALGFSAGVMLYVSFVEILPEGRAELGEAFGQSRGSWLATGVFFAGIAVIAVIDKLVPEAINPHEPGSTEQKRRRAMMMKAGAMTAVALAIHNFPEGFATFTAALANPSVAIPVVVAIAIHNIPEGIAVAVPVRDATGSRAKGLLWATVSGFAEPVGAAVGFLFLMPVMGPAALGVSFAAVAGIMVYICLDELLPTAVKTGKHHVAIYGFIAGMAVMALSLELLG